MQYVLKELCISQTFPPLVWCDNQSVAALAANPVFHARSKNIELDLHFIRDKSPQERSHHSIHSFHELGSKYLHETSSELTVFHVSDQAVNCPTPSEVAGG